MPMVLRRPSRICWQIGKTQGVVSIHVQWIFLSYSNIKSYNRKYPLNQLLHIWLYIMYSKISGRKKVFKSLFFLVFNRIFQSCDKKDSVENAN